MYMPSVLRAKGVVALLALAVCVVVAPADSAHLQVVGTRMVVAQITDTTVPTDAPALENGHETPASTPALPDPAPRLNKKRVAFWGVVFMLATSAAFVIFGVWAMRKAPKPGQQRPE
jgi:hypothetical protein